MSAPDDLPFVDLVSGARRLGHYRWIERRLFEVLGGWVAGAEPSARGLLATSSRHHAEHADRLGEVLPTLPNVDGITPEGVTVAPDDDAELVALVDGLEVDAAAVADPLARLRSTTLPALIASYRDHLGRLSPVGDGPAIRVLEAIVRDEEDDLASLAAWSPA
jgi:hypothetical protein